MIDRRSRAIHEAGHAVMAYHLNKAIQCATIVPASDKGGRVDIVHPGSKDAKKWANEAALCLIASYPACLLAKVDMVGTSDDLGVACATLKRYDGDPDAFEKCKASAIEIMSRPENVAAVQRLADLLLERETLDGDAVRACISQSDADLKR